MKKLCIFLPDQNRVKLNLSSCSGFLISLHFTRNIQKFWKALRLRTIKEKGIDMITFKKTSLRFITNVGALENASVDIDKEDFVFPGRAQWAENRRLSN